jgi:hypothetical protein
MIDNKFVALQIRDAEGKAMGKIKHAWKEEGPEPFRVLCSLVDFSVTVWIT